MPTCHRCPPPLDRNRKSSLIRRPTCTLEASGEKLGDDVECAVGFWSLRRAAHAGWSSSRTADFGRLQSSILGADIERIVKVKSGVNTVVEVQHRGERAQFASAMKHDALDVVCLSGPPGQMRTVCAAIGHPN